MGVAERRSSGMREMFTKAEVVLTVCLLLRDEMVISCQRNKFMRAKPCAGQKGSRFLAIFGSATIDLFQFGGYRINRHALPG